MAALGVSESAYYLTILSFCSCSKSRNIRQLKPGIDVVSNGKASSVVSMSGDPLSTPSGGGPWHDVDLLRRGPWHKVDPLRRGQWHDVDPIRRGSWHKVYPLRRGSWHDVDPLRRGTWHIYWRYNYSVWQSIVHCRLNNLKMSSWRGESDG